MKLRIRNSMIIMAVLFGLSLASLVSLTSASRVKAENMGEPALSEAKARRLEGTWRVQVTIRNCQTSAELKTFPAFLTFAQGGTLVETTTGIPPALRSPGHGGWEHTGGQTFLAASQAFLFAPDGTWTGTQTLKQSITMGDTPDDFTSNATIEVTAPNGSVVSTGCATAVAHRVD